MHYSANFSTFTFDFQDSGNSFLKNSEKLPPCTVSNEFLGDCEFMPFCLAQVPNCNDPSKFSDRQVYANSVDPDQTPIPPGFTMFAILSESFWLIMSKNDPDQESYC